MAGFDNVDPAYVCLLLVLLAARRSRTHHDHAEFPFMKTSARRLDLRIFPIR
jgi:hypothetical protein